MTSLGKDTLTCEDYSLSRDLSGFFRVKQYLLFQVVVRYSVLNFNRSRSIKAINKKWMYHKEILFLLCGESRVNSTKVLVLPILPCFYSPATHSALFPVFVTFRVEQVVNPTVSGAL